jgi:hypothetical protein
LPAGANDSLANDTTTPAMLVTQLFFEVCLNSLFIFVYSLCVDCDFTADQ